MFNLYKEAPLTFLLSEWPKLYGVLAILSVKGLSHVLSVCWHRFSGAVETCAYLSFHDLQEAADKAHSDSLLVSLVFTSFHSLL